MIVSRINCYKSQRKIDGVRTNLVNLLKSQFSITPQPKSQGIFYIKEVHIITAAMLSLIAFLLSIFSVYEYRKQGKLITSLTAKLNKLEEDSKKWFFQRRSLE